MAVDVKSLYPEEVRLYDGSIRSVWLNRRMNKTRLEAFSDAVIAIIMTIMVLELKIPHGADLTALKPLLPVFLAYILSFVYLGIYWNNHHHMLQATRSVSGSALWANLLLMMGDGCDRGEPLAAESVRSLKYWAGE